MDSNVLNAFIMTLFAGLATGIGSIVALFFKRTNTKFLSVSLGFSAGVMIYVSMIEIFPQAQSTLILALGEKQGSTLTVVAFFIGMFLIAIIDKIIPEDQNPHEVCNINNMYDEDGSLREVCKTENGQSGLMRTGTFTAFAIAIHNFPEGIATFVSALQEPSLAIPIVVAIAIHNIPEGIAVSVPIYHATGNRTKAFIYSFLSGLSEPVGALVGYMILLPFMNDVVFGVIFAAVGGIMVFISLDELLPTAHEYGEHHLAIYGMIAGMIVMAVSLLLFI